jgi:hypothetical protein
MKLAEKMIETVDWARYQVMSGGAEHFGQQLSDFIADERDSARPGLWSAMENSVFAQDDIFSAAEPTISVLLASLIDDQHLNIRTGVLELLFWLVQGASYRDDDLGRRCLSNAATGGWLLAREAVAGPPAIKELCLEILDIAAPECADVVRSGS